MSVLVRFRSLSADAISWNLLDHHPDQMLLALRQRTRLVVRMILKIRHAASTAERSAGILTCYPSTTPFGLALGPTNPPSTDVAEETLDFRRGGFSPPSRYSCQHSHLMPLQHASRHTFTADINAPLPSYIRIHGFGYLLEPR